MVIYGGHILYAMFFFTILTCITGSILVRRRGWDSNSMPFYMDAPALDNTNTSWTLESCEKKF